MAMGINPTQRVLELVKAKGPVIPSQISGEIGTNIIIASAILSQLASTKGVKVSHVKVGGTPLYYTQGQEHRLQEYTKYLHEKERKAFDALKMQLVLRDTVLEPVMRVALREIKDFAIPLNVQTPEGIELFWKWYLISNEQAEVMLAQILGEKKEEPKTEQTTLEAAQAPAVQEIPVEKATEKAKEPKKKKTVTDAFINKVYEFFKKNGIEIGEQQINKTKTEAEFAISVPSPVGTIKYYCKAKDKKVCNDGDLSTAYVQGQIKKMPVLFLTNGGLTKKATEMLQREFSSINVKKI